MKAILLLLTILLPFLPADNDPQRMSLEEHGFDGQWYPSEQADAPILIVLGGSEGGHTFGSQMASWLNESGYHVLSVAYFGADGLPRTMSAKEV